MTKMLFIFLFIVYFGNTAHGAVLFAPESLRSAKSTWHKISGEFKGEYYRNYNVGDQTIFRVLERYAPAVDSLIVEAIERRGQLRIADPAIIYFDSQDLIRANFSVACQKDTIATVDPKDIELSYRPLGCFGKAYYVSFSENGSDIKISKGVYGVLELARETALLQGNLVEINMNLLRNKSNDKKRSLATLVPRKGGAKVIDDNSLCVVCLENPKDRMVTPCNHVCLCKECSTNDYQACPICNGDIGAIQKVHF